MDGILSVQERLEQRAGEIAKTAACRVMSNLPELQGYVTLPRGLMRADSEGRQMMDMPWSVLRGEIRKFLEKKFSEDALDKLTRQLIDSLDK